MNIDERVDELRELLAADYGHTYQGMLVDILYDIQQQIDKAINLKVKLDIKANFKVHSPAHVLRINW